MVAVKHGLIVGHAFGGHDRHSPLPFDTRGGQR